jgi:hypothetical protein
MARTMLQVIDADLAMGSPMATQQMTHDLETMIVQRSREDERFHQEFLVDPARAFWKYLQIPADWLPQTVVYEKSAGTWHIVVPPKTNARELSDTDLERVAGGTQAAVVSAAVAVSVGLPLSIIVSAEVGGW